MAEEDQMIGWWRSALVSISVTGLAALMWQARTPPSFDRFVQEFTSAYAQMDPDPYVLEFKDRLRNIPPSEVLLERQRFFNDRLAELDRSFNNELTPQQTQQAALIRYMIRRHQEQLELELAWSNAGRPMPLRGLENMPVREAWYLWLIERFTSVVITPEEVKALGEREIKRCKHELDRLAKELGHSDRSSFINELSADHFLIGDKQQLIGDFARVDSTVRNHLYDFVEIAEVPVVHAMEWPGAGPNTPPGIYLSRENNAYGSDVFQFNFYNSTFNRRALSWIYLHEAIPGHHLQSSMRRQHSHEDLRAHLAEGGNFEGWACYVEYHGDKLGLYADPWQEVGKWEWDLVRSVRLVLDVGIHHEGWTRDEALRFWHETLPEQPAIAEREVDRVTAMPGQVLSYKVGADRIERMRVALEKEGMPMKEFHRKFLEAGQLPLELMETHLRARISH